jgi:hypothetical protein
MSTEYWAARVTDINKNHYFYTGPLGGFITKNKNEATFAFTEDQAKELGDVMLKFLHYAIAGKLINSPLKSKK